MKNLIVILGFTIYLAACGGGGGGGRIGELGEGVIENPDNWLEDEAFKRKQKALVATGFVATPGLEIPRNEKNGSNGQPVLRAEDQHRKGSSYAFRKEYKRAMYWYTQAAEQGNVSSQYWLARLYNRYTYKPISTRDNAIKAISWYYKAAKQGHKDAQHEAGYFFQSPKVYIEKGEIITLYSENIELSFKWYHMAQLSGNSEDISKRIPIFVATSKNVSSIDIGKGNVPPLIKKYEKEAEACRAQKFVGCMLLPNPAPQSKP